MLPSSGLPADDVPSCSSMNGDSALAGEGAFGLRVAMDTTPMRPYRRMRHVFKPRMMIMIRTLPMTEPMMMALVRSVSELLLP